MPEIELDSTCFTDKYANLYTNNTINLKLAIRRGFEPLTSCVTGMRSNQTELTDHNGTP